MHGHGRVPGHCSSLRAFSLCDARAGQQRRLQPRLLWQRQQRFLHRRLRRWILRPQRNLCGRHSGVRDIWLHWLDAHLRAYSLLECQPAYRPGLGGELHGPDDWRVVHGVLRPRLFGCCCQLHLHEPGRFLRAAADLHSANLRRLGARSARGGDPRLQRCEIWKQVRHQLRCRPQPGCEFGTDRTTLPVGCCSGSSYPAGSISSV
mmetsp:Transcript_75841/g.136829  ORF Transcript_75841/g.136829 Transcript_75841/m.136829 type:complete len:205 (-) Transcript_75841:640-1254(-)